VLALPRPPPAGRGRGACGPLGRLKAAGLFWNAEAARFLESLKAPQEPRGRARALLRLGAGLRQACGHKAAAAGGRWRPMKRLRKAPGKLLQRGPSGRPRFTRAIIDRDRPRIQFPAPTPSGASRARAPVRGRARPAVAAEAGSGQEQLLSRASPRLGRKRAFRGRAAQA
jgi:hypothetical protein